MSSPEANIVYHFEEELLAGFIPVDSLKLCRELLKHKLLSKEVKNFFESLDHDNTEADTRARYLLKLVTDKVVKNECCFKNLLNVLVKVDCSDLCNKLKEELRRSEFVNDRNPEAGAQIGKKRSRVNVGSKILNENDVAILTEVLTDCCHKWEEIGLSLGLKQHEIKECGEASSYMLKLSGILRKWLGSTTFNAVPPTLDSLKTVLSRGIISMPDIACELVETFTNKMSKYTSYKSKKACRPVPLSITYQSTDIEIANGKSAILEVKAECNENVRYQWNKDGQKISKGCHYSHVDSPFLLINTVKLEVEGNYSCTVISSNNERVESDLISLSVIFPLISQYFFEIYSKYDELPKDSWPPVASSSFVNLALITKNKLKSHIYDYTVQGDMDDIMENKEKIEYEELFGKYESGTLLLVEGRPGSGKTTLMHKVTRDWSLKKDVLIGAKLVILIPLRLFSSFKNDLCLPDIIQFYLGTTNTVQEKEILSHIENSRGDGVCFIIDGLDEYQQRDVKSSIIYKLMNKILFPLSMVIVASRPVGSAKFRDKRQRQINKRVEVLGFSKQEIFAYISGYNFDNDQTATTLEEYLKCHDKVLHMCYLPVHAAMICYLYSEMGENIPQTETKVYECFTLLSIKRKLMSDDEVKYANFSSITQLTGDVKICFYNVCELAFQMTLASKQAIHQNETSVLLSSTSSNSASFGLVTIDSAAKLFSYEEFYTYLHLTFQEYLASVHLTTLTGDDLIKIINTCKNKPEFLMVWRFLCGSIDFSEKGFVLDELFSSESIDTMNKLLCGFESQQQKVCSYIMQSGSLSFKEQTFTTSDFVAFNYVITNSKHFLNRLEFLECSMQEEGVKLFLENLTPEHFSQLIYLGYHKKNCTVSQFKVLNIILLRCSSLEIFNLEKTELSKSGLNELAHGVNLPTLDILKLQIPLKASVLDHHTILNRLKFKSNRLSKVEFNCGEHKRSATEEINNSYQMLYAVFKDCIYWNPECPMINNILGHIQLSDFSDCSKLELVNCGLTDDHMDMLVNCLVTYKKLKELKLDFNRISGAGAKILASSFEKCAKFAVFSAHCNQIDDSGALALAKEFIHLNSFARVLDLQCNAISEEGVRAVSEVTKTLSKFHLFITVNTRGFAGSNENNINSQVLQESVDMIWKGNSQAKRNAFKCLGLVPEIHINGKTDSFMNFKWTHDDIQTLIEGLKFFPNVHTLNLALYKMGSSGAEALAAALKNCTNIHTLNLADNRICSAGAEALAAALKNCTNIHTLNLADNRIGSAGVVALAAALKKCSNIHTLNLADNGISASGTEALAATLKICTNIHTLYLSDNKIGSSGAEALAAALKNCTNIHTLNLADNRICSAGAEALAAALKNCTNIHTLNLADNRIGSAGVVALAAALKKCSNIHTLNLADNGISASGAEALAATLKICTNIHTLYLSDNKIGSSGAEALAAALKSCTCIHTLYLSDNQIGSSGAEALAAALKSCTNIHTLSLAHNVIGSSGAAALGAAMKSCTSIDTLNLARIGMDSSGAEALGAALKSCTSIRTLHLGYNRIGSSGAEALAAALKSCTSIHTLNLSDNIIGSSGAEALAAALKSCISINILYLGNNGMGSSGAEALGAALKSCTCIHTLDLACNEIGSSGAEALGAALKSCTSIHTLDLAYNKIGPSGAEALGSALKSCSSIHTLNLADNIIGSSDAEALRAALKNCTNIHTVDIARNRSELFQLVQNLKCCSEKLN